MQHLQISICLSLHTIGIILDHKWCWTYPCRKHTGQQALFFLEPKICTKIGHNTNNVKPTASYTGSEERKFKQTVLTNNCFEFERNLLNKFVYSFSFFFLLCHLLFRVFLNIGGMAAFFRRKFLDKKGHFLLARTNRCHF